MALLIGLLAQGGHAETTTGMITGDRVNLRNAAGLESDVVGQVAYGDEVDILELQDEWLRIRPPAHIPVWVHGGLLFEEREVRARVLNVRNGPGTQFTSFGQLHRGEAVQVVEQLEEWRRIETPKSVSLWISREFVQLPEPQAVAVPAAVPGATSEVVPTEDVGGGVAVEAATDSEMDAVQAQAQMPEVSEETIEEAGLEIAPVELVDANAISVQNGDVGMMEGEAEPLAEETAVAEVPVAEDVVVEAVVGVEYFDAPENLPLVPLPGQGTASMRRGWVKTYLLAGSSPSRFHLVYRQGNQEQTLAYLQGDDESLRQLSGQAVQVRGRDFWVTGQRVPVMRVDSVDALETPAQ